MLHLNIESLHVFFNKPPFLETTVTAQVNISISEDSVKVLAASALALGVAYLCFKYIEGLPPRDIPLPEEARQNSNHPNLKPQQIEDIGFDEEVKNRAIPLLNEGLWNEAVREAAISLFDTIRTRSGVLDDSTNLIRKVFRGNNPVLKFINLAPQHILNPEIGIIHYLDGFSQFTRKVHMHATVKIDKEEALLKVNIAAYLAEHVKRNTIKLS